MLDWLERSFEAHDFWLLNLQFDATFDDLRDEPHFQAVAEKVRKATKR